MRKFGLIGKNISYSFSKTYFSKKFEKESIKDASYENFDLECIKEFNSVLKRNSELAGLNVTIPYKEEIIPFLNKLSKKAEKIGAVNTIKINKDGTLKGYNTDCYGFKKSITPYLKKYHQKALILGTGGASIAIAFVLQELNIEYSFVSRSKSCNYFAYGDLNFDILREYTVIINCSPVGTFPSLNECPHIPYQYLTKKHLLYDLIYNPSETLFLKKGKQQGAKICNGLKMLELQAEKAWKIWNKIK